ncbi:MAG: hypothetical protein M3421_15520 [Bacteroidota bacterium]|nr:hypothetical protein [Bacteroidota bacterium]
MNPSFLKLLKEETQNSHLSLEKHPLLCSLTSSNLTYSQYLKILLKLYGFFLPLEKAVLSFQNIHTFLPDLENRRKASVLRFGKL